MEPTCQQDALQRLNYNKISYLLRNLMFVGKFAVGKDVCCQTEGRVTLPVQTVFSLKRLYGKALGEILP